MKIGGDNRRCPLCSKGYFKKEGRSVTSNDYYLALVDAGCDAPVDVLCRIASKLYQSMTEKGASR